MPKVKSIEYSYHGQSWTIDDVKGFEQRFGKIPAEAMPGIHTMLAADTNLWTLLRLCFGWGQTMVSLRDEAFRQVWPLQRVADHYDTDLENIEALLDTVKGKIEICIATFVPSETVEVEVEVKDVKESKPKSTEAVAPAEPDHPPIDLATSVHTPTRSDLPDDKVATLLRLGFSLEMFALAGRTRDTMEVEIRWFLARLEEWERLFAEPMVKTLVRQTLINELHLRRIDDEMLLMQPTSDKYWKCQEKKTKLEANYQKQLTDLEMLCPNFKAAAAKTAIKGVFSEVVEGYLQFKRDRCNDIVDGLFTAVELQCMMRDAEEHGIRYRPSIPMMVIEAKANLWDPKWGYKFPQELLQAVDAGFREGFEKLQEKAGIKKTKLLDDGPAGEYKPVFVPELDVNNLNEDREIIPPEIPIPIEEPASDVKRRKN